MPIFVLKYWKLLTGAAAIIALILGIYYKGYSDAKNYYEALTAQELTKRYQEWQESTIRNSQTTNNLIKARRTKPSDNLDSCILSHNPMRQKCD